jgi:hypothetical protein
MTTSVLYGAAASNYHPAIAFLACVAAFVAIEHLQSLASTETMVDRLSEAADQHKVALDRTESTVTSLTEASHKIDNSVNLILNRQGVRELRAYLHRYYVENYTVRGTIYFWDWQLTIVDDMDVLAKMNKLVCDYLDLLAETKKGNESAGISRRNEGLKDFQRDLSTLLLSSHLHKYVSIGSTDGREYPPYATSCFLLRLADLMLRPEKVPFSSIQIYAASPTLTDKGNLGESLPLYNYRNFNHIQCLQNYLGCCAQCFFVSKFNQCLRSAVKAGLVGKGVEGQYHATDESRIKLDLVTSPPWHYAISRTILENRRPIKEGFVTQLFRSVSNDDVAIDITAEDVPVSKPFVPKRVSADQGAVESSTETFARYDDLLQRLVLEAVPLEPYLVSLSVYYGLVGKPMENLPNSIVEGVPFASFTQDLTDVDRSSNLSFYQNRLLQNFLAYELEIGKKRVPGRSGRDNGLVRRIL